MSGINGGFQPSAAGPGARGRDGKQAGRPAAAWAPLEATLPLRPRQPARGPTLESLRRTMAWLGGSIGAVSTLGFWVGSAWLLRAVEAQAGDEQQDSHVLYAFMALSTLTSAADALYACLQTRSRGEDEPRLGRGDGVVARVLYQGLRRCGGLEEADAIARARLEGIVNPALAFATLLAFLEIRGASLDPEDPLAAGWLGVGHVGAGITVALIRAVHAVVEDRIASLERRAERAREHALRIELRPVPPRSAQHAFGVPMAPAVLRIEPAAPGHAIGSGMERPSPWPSGADQADSPSPDESPVTRKLFDWLNIVESGTSRPRPVPRGGGPADPDARSAQSPVGDVAAPPHGYRVLPPFSPLPDGRPAAKRPESDET